MDSETKPWDRQPGERNLWYDRFTRYRLIGATRSLLGIYKLDLQERGRKGKKEPTRAAESWRKASAEWNWKARAEAWDEIIRQERIAAEEEARRDMLRRHAHQAQTLQSIGVLKLSSLDVKRIVALQPSERADAMKAISIAEARHYIGDGVKLERQALGLPEHLLAVAQMTESQLFERYQHILTALSGEDDAPSDE